MSKFLNDPITNLIKASNKKDGCDLCSSCVNPPCVLPLCKYDLHSGQKMESIIRASLSKRLYKQGLSLTFVARIFNITTASVHQYLTGETGTIDGQGDESCR